MTKVDAEISSQMATKRAVIVHRISGMDERNRPIRETYGLFDSEDQAGKYASENGFGSWSYSYVYVVRESAGIVPIPVKVTCSLNPEFEGVFPSREEYENSESSRVDCDGYHTVTELA